MARHGTISRYTDGCHCPECVAVGRPASLERSRASRARRITGDHHCSFCVRSFPTKTGLTLHVTAIHDGGVK